MEDKKYKELQKYFYQYVDHFDEDKKGRILVLGVGNYIMGDEGVGVHSIFELSQHQLADNVDIVDGATGSFELIPILARYDKVILIDATIDNRPAGSINVLYPKFSSDFPTALSAHDIGLKDMIDALDFKGDLPKLILITVSIKEMISMQDELSKDVQKALPEVAKNVKILVDRINKGELLA